MTKPTATLTYNKDTHEFTINVNNSLEVEYQLTYKVRMAKPEDATASANLASSQTSLKADKDATSSTLESIEYGLGGAGKADGKKVYSEVVLAGTESSGDQYVHDPASGTLILQALTSEDKIFKFTQRFVIDESGKMRFTSTETTSRAADGSILGDSTASANLKKTASASATPGKTTNTAGTAGNETFAQHPPTTGQPEANYLGWIIGLSLLAGLIVAAMVVILRRKKMAALENEFGHKVYTHAGLGGEMNKPVEEAAG